MRVFPQHIVERIVSVYLARSISTSYRRMSGESSDVSDYWTGLLLSYEKNGLVVCVWNRAVMSFLSHARARQNKSDALQGTQMAPPMCPSNDRSALNFKLICVPTWNYTDLHIQVVQLLLYNLVSRSFAASCDHTPLTFLGSLRQSHVLGSNYTKESSSTVHRQGCLRFLNLLSASAFSCTNGWSTRKLPLSCTKHIIIPLNQTDAQQKCSTQSF